MTEVPPHTLVIAEAGINHNGDVGRALEMIDVAAEAGADCVKFQTFRADRLVTAGAERAAYQTAATEEGSQLDLLRAVELPLDAWDRLSAHCRARGIEFMSTAFDEDSLDLLLALGVARLKVPSGEVTNGPFLLRHAQARLPLILSTGMATLDEVTAALAVIDAGVTGSTEGLSRRVLAAVPRAESARRLAGLVTLLHCTTEYPAPFEDVNLRAMDTLADSFGLPVGLSDHSPGIAAPIAAVARGACMVEKHFTLSRELPGPDHQASLEPGELAEMVRGIRAVEAMLGDGVKAPRPSERKNIAIARRALVAARPIRAGEIITAEAICARRPARGLSPMAYWDVVGRQASRDYAADEPIAPEDAGEQP